LSIKAGSPTLPHASSGPNGGMNKSWLLTPGTMEVDKRPVNAGLDTKSYLYCVYVAVGQKRSTVAQSFDILPTTECRQFTRVVAATASDAAPLQFLAPYTGCAMEDHFRDNGMHAVIMNADVKEGANNIESLTAALKLPRAMKQSCLLPLVAKIDSQSQEMQATSEDEAKAALKFMCYCKKAGGDLDTDMKEGANKIKSLTAALKLFLAMTLSCLPIIVAAIVSQSQNMQAQFEEEAKAESKFMCYCKKAHGDLDVAMKKGANKIESLTAALKNFS